MSVKLVDICLTGLPNIPCSRKNNDVDKPVAQLFNGLSHSVSDMEVCAMTPVSCGNGSRLRKRKAPQIRTYHHAASFAQ